MLSLNENELLEIKNILQSREPNHGLPRSVLP